MMVRILAVAVIGALSLGLAACGDGETRAPAVIEWTATPSPAGGIEFPQDRVNELIELHKSDTEKYGLVFTCLYSGGGWRDPVEEAAALGISQIFTHPAAGTATFAVNGFFVESFYQVGYEGAAVTRAKKIQLLDAICYVPEL